MSDEEREEAAMDRTVTHLIAEARPDAEAIYRELMARKKMGQAQKGDATRLKAAREILRRSGGIPRKTV